MIFVSESEKVLADSWEHTNDCPCSMEDELSQGLKNGRNKTTV
jgi:hypothetical protein